MVRLLCLIALTALCSTGCSAWIAERGTDLRLLTTREEVRASMGTPLASGTEGEADFDEFHSRRKFCEQRRGFFHFVGFCQTIGLAEFILFPMELGRLGNQVIRGQDIRFYYDATGSVTQITINGRECCRTDPLDIIE